MVIQSIFPIQSSDTDVYPFIVNVNVLLSDSGLIYPTINKKITLQKTSFSILAVVFVILLIIFFI